MSTTQPDVVPMRQRAQTGRGPTMGTETSTPASREDAILPGQDEVFGSLYPPGVKFEAPGQLHRIILDGVGQVQDRDYNSGDPLFWQDGRPKMVAVIYGQIGDGKLGSWYIRGQRADKALRDAMRAAQLQRLARGDTVQIVRGPDEEVPPKNGRGDSKWANTFDVVIEPAVFGATES